MNPGAAVADTDVLIALDRLDCLGHLGLIFGQMLVPGAVRSEFLEQELPEDRRPSPALTTLIGVPPFETCGDFDSVSLHLLLGQRLGRGESEGIAQAAQRGSTHFMTDDRRARKLAGQRGLRVVGTARLVARLSRLGLIEDYSASIERLRSRGHRISEPVARQALLLEVRGESL